MDREGGWESPQAGRENWLNKKTLNFLHKEAKLLCDSRVCIEQKKKCTLKSLS